MNRLLLAHRSRPHGKAHTPFPRLPPACQGCPTRSPGGVEAFEPWRSSSCPRRSPQLARGTPAKRPTSPAPPVPDNRSILSMPGHGAILRESYGIEISRQEDTSSILQVLQATGDTGYHNRPKYKFLRGKLMHRPTKKRLAC